MQRNRAFLQGEPSEHAWPPQASSRKKTSLNPRTIEFKGETIDSRDHYVKRTPVQRVVARELSDAPMPKL
jgi:hypothetical protein